MKRCVVSGCPNRSAANASSSNRTIFTRPAKRFFSFPKDPTRVKIWLAALRETDRQDSAELLFICEDHFLPEDLVDQEVTADAIPIMPPCLEGDMMNPWGAESSGEEDQWASATAPVDDDDDDVEDEDDDGGEEESEDEPEPEPEPEPLVKEEPPEPDPGPTVGPRHQLLDDVVRESAPVGSNNWDDSSEKRSKRSDVSLGVLTRGFLELLMMSPDGTVDVRHVMATLRTGRRRVYDISNVLNSIDVLEKESTNKLKWTGKCPVSSFLAKSQTRFQRELQSLKLVEDTLDTLIKSCAQQLFNMTDDPHNASLAYVTHEDVGRLAAFQQQTLIVVRAPQETKLEVPAPQEDSIQIHLKGGQGPIEVQTCDMETAERSGCFTTLEESRIKTSALHTEAESTDDLSQCVATA